MKKITLLSFLFLTSILFVQAQEKGDFEIGAVVGLNLATFYGDDADNADSITAFQAGVTGEYYFSDRWGFKSGLIYDSKGAEEFGVSFELNYLFIPIYANWHFGANRNWYLNFGPHIDFLLSVGDAVDKDLVSPVDVGLGVGIGYKFDVSDATKIFIEYQGAGGFISVPEDSSFEFNNTRSAFNIGVLFTP